METANTQNSSPEIWQVDVNGQIYETSFEEMTQWIAEGALLPGDKVRRGNLRWLEANRVPLLHEFFNAKALGIDPPRVSTTVNSPAPENTPSAAGNFQNSQNFTQTSPGFETPTTSGGSFSSQTQSYQSVNNSTPENSCVIHADEEARYFCETCLNSFCKTCPTSYGGSVRICPMCGAMCKPVGEVRQNRQKQVQNHPPVTESFGFSDFGKALAFPFKYKASFVMGAVMFMLFTLGQSASGVGGIYMLVAAIFSAMMANMLTFGILANTVENFSQGNLDTNFMPSFDDFSMWDDVVHPFLLSIGAYISSFGPLIAIAVIMIFFILGATKQELNSIQQKTVDPTAPELRHEYDSVKDIPQIKSISEGIKEKAAEHNQQLESIQNNSNGAGQPRVYDEEKEFQRLNDQINQQRKSQLESAFGKNEEMQTAEGGQILLRLANTAVPFLLLMGIAFLWGVFYLPAACAIAGYTRSFGSTINPLVGLDTIKRLGVDYWKILGMVFLLSIFVGILQMILRVVLLPFDLPRMGNLPAVAIGSFFTFYFSIVFSGILGYALYKNADKLNLYR